jgi:heat shock factor-binding protein 1
MKIMIKACSKPLIRRIFKIAKYTYHTLTSPSQSKSESSDKATEELSVVIDDLLNQLGTKFSTISEELLGKMDEMSRRLDSLEAAIQAGKGGEGK